MDHTHCLPSRARLLIYIELSLWYLLSKCVRSQDPTGTKFPLKYRTSPCSSHLGARVTGGREAELGLPCFALCPNRGRPSPDMGTDIGPGQQGGLGGTCKAAGEGRAGLPAAETICLLFSTLEQPIPTLSCQKSLLAQPEGWFLSSSHRIYFCIPSSHYWPRLRQMVLGTKQMLWFLFLSLSLMCLHLSLGASLDQTGLKSWSEIFLPGTPFLLSDISSICKIIWKKVNSYLWQKPSASQE